MKTLQNYITAVIFVLFFSGCNPNNPAIEDEEQAKVTFINEELELFRTRLKFCALELDDLRKSYEGEQAEKILECSKATILVKWILGETRVYPKFEKFRISHIKNLRARPNGTGEDPHQELYSEVINSSESRKFSGKKYEFLLEEVKLFENKLKYCAKMLDNYMEESAAKCSKTLILVKWAMEETRKGNQKNKGLFLGKLYEMPGSEREDPHQELHDEV